MCFGEIRGKHSLRTRHKIWNEGEIFMVLGTMLKWEIFLVHSLLVEMKV